MSPTVQTCLWFDHQAQDAAETYVSLLPDSRIVASYPARGNPGKTFLVHVELLGQRYSFLNGGPHYKLTPAASIEVHLDTQAEVDRLWDALLAGGEPMRCGWLTDRFGVSWQIIPRVLIDLMLTTDDAVAGRVTQAMMGMVKLDMAALEAAARA
ncbi:VOC family protein [Neotabrizicola shimadae]|uniref:VOC family protein n=1 Tax=Neotabrizicola shimadae TaxID=2807096 RepID=A0A8G0ZWP2_9RHOB|nr:VOC family protein [Neotabrizicola shimadae]QYZ70805.1 VOC family protein [Neotabrizicola shimadae]